MKLQKVFPIASIVLVVLMGSCKKDQTFQYPGSSSGILSKDKSTALSSALSPIDKSATSLMVSGSLATVNLGVAGNFAILSKSGITDVYKSAILGDIGTSPITGAALLVSCAEVVGTVYTVDAAGPLPCRVTSATMLTTAVGDMQTAYTDAAGRINPDFLNLGAGNIGGKTLSPGLYKWTSPVVIPTDVTISGGPNDVWIFQVDGTLNMSSAVKITLAGGAQAKNIFWQAAGAVTFGTTSHFEGNILGQTGINLQTGASINGRMLAQTAVTLQMNTVNKPQ
jgi:Ice-binding-like